MPQTNDIIDRAVKAASQVFRSRATHPTDMTLTYDGWVKSYFERKARDGRDRDLDAMHAETIAAKAVKDCYPVEAAWAARYAAHAAWAEIVANACRSEAQRASLEMHRQERLDYASWLESQVAEFGALALEYAAQAAARMGQSVAA